MKDKDWDRLLWNLQRQSCVLMLGPQVLPPEYPLSPRALSQRLADELEASALGSQGLAHVAQQFVQSDRHDRLDLEREVTRFFQAAAPIPDLYANLAALPFYFTLSSCHDDLLVRAFREVGKEPSHIFYNYRSGQQDLVPAGSVQAPLVYDLYGSCREPSSLVLTEADLLDFLVAVITGNPSLPANIRSELGKNVSFLFLGFGMHQWYLRILLHVLQFNARKRAVALEPPATQLAADASVLFFAGYRIEVLNCELAQFTAELRQRFEAASGPVQAKATVSLEGSAKVFLSYASEDGAAAEALYQGMRAGGLDVWMDRQELKGGELWDRAIVDRLNDSDYFVVVNSRTLTTKCFSYVNKEINLALSRQQFVRSGFRFIIPVRIDDAPLLQEFKDVQAIALEAGDVTPLVSTIKRDHQRRSRASA